MTSDLVTGPLSAACNNLLLQYHTPIPRIRLWPNPRHPRSSRDGARPQRRRTQMGSATSVGDKQRGVRRALSLPTDAAFAEDFDRACRQCDGAQPLREARSGHLAHSCRASPPHVAAFPGVQPTHRLMAIAHLRAQCRSPQENTNGEAWRPPHSCRATAFTRRCSRRASCSPRRCSRRSGFGPSSWRSRRCRIAVPQPCLWLFWR